MKIPIAVSMWFVVLPGLVMGQAASSVENTPATAGSESLGNQLLDDLPATIPSTKPESGEEGATQTDGLSPPSLASGEDAGEDLGVQSGPQLLARVRSDMRQAEVLLGGPTTKTNTSPLKQAGVVQKRVVAQLDELIAELSKQCQGGQGQSTSSPSTQQSQRSAAKPSQPSRTATTSKAPARDSSDPLNNSSAQAVDKGEVDELVNHLWGHLPERSREQVLQSFSDEFLPKYEVEIEQYYRRLSDEQRGKP